MRATSLKFPLVFFTLIIIATLVFPFPAGAVVNWTKGNGGNPVLERGTGGAWDAGKIERPTVVKDYNTFEMWYSGKNIEVGSGNTMYVGHASNTSGDGINWVKHSTYVLAPTPPPSQGGNPLALDTGHVGFCSVINAGNGIYKMWYSGTTQYNDASSEIPSAVNGFQIFYATSADGGLTWSKYNSATQVAVARGNPGAWDQDLVGCPTVVYESGVTPAYKMWYLGASGMSNPAKVGYAWSNDGINWTKLPQPVLYPGPVGAWDSFSVMMPMVIKEGPLYRMWFEGDGPINGAAGHGYAWSMDGMIWYKYDGNPVLMQSGWGTGAFDTDGVMDPMVLKDGNTYKMWYHGYSESSGAAFGYATSPAYPAGAHLQINQAQVANRNTASGGALFVAVMPEGPSPLDINGLKVTWPDGGVSQFNQTQLFNLVGYQIPSMGIPGSPPPGTYTFSVTANNGESATKQLTLSPSTISVPTDGTGGGDLNRQIELGGTTWSDPSVNQAYITGTTPTFKWKPSVGDSYYYRVRVYEWKGQAIWYIHDPLLGSAKDGSGYLSVTVPQGVLKANAPYHWEIQVSDTDDVWSAHNQSMSGQYDFYTGTKDTTAYDFIRADSGVSPAIFGDRSFRSGDAPSYFIPVVNLAPWDIDTTTNKFRIEGPPGFNPIYPNVSGNSTFGNATTSNVFPFLYAGTPTNWSNGGVPPGGTYTFYVYDKGGNFETQIVSISGTTLPVQVDRRDMTPADNSQLSDTQPTLTWKSKGTDYQYRVRIFDWNMRRLDYQGSWLTGQPEGTQMSVSIPAGTLHEHSPYHWWVEAIDPDHNSRTGSNWLGFMTGGPPVGQGWVADFGSSGLWHYDMAGGWTQLNTVDPGLMVAADVDNDGMDELVVAFSGYGLYYYHQSTGWNKINSILPDAMVRYGHGIAADYGTTYGLWRYTKATNWTQLTPLKPALMAAADVDNDGADELVGSFTGYGLYYHDLSGAWTQINTVLPDAMVRYGNGVAADYGTTYGLWRYTKATNWTQLTPLKPALMAAADVDNDGADELVGSFTGYGLYYHDLSGAWTQINTVLPSAVARHGKGVAADYGATYGLWRYATTTGWKKLNFVDPGIMCATDLGGVGVDDELAVAFSGYGLYYYDLSANSWEPLNKPVPENIIKIDLFN